MRTTAIAAVICSSLVAGAPQPAKTAGISASAPLLTVSQGGASVASTAGKVALRRQPFELVFTFPVDQPVVMVSVSSTPEVHGPAVAGGTLDEYFKSGLGMVEGVFNDDRHMSVAPAGQRGFHYWYYRRDGDHRFDFGGVVKKDKSLIARRTIARFTVDRVAHTVAEYPGTDVYVVAVIGTTTDSGVVERQRQALHLVFSDPPTPRPADRDARTEDPPVTSPTRVGHLAPEPKQTKHVPPEYPRVAVEAAVEGVVTADVTIGLDGRVTNAQVVRSIPMLDAAALAAVRQWEFTPPLVNGRPRPIITTVAVTFVLPASAGGGGKGARAAMTRGVVTGDRYENPYFDVHLGWPTEWQAVPDAEVVREGGSLGKVIQAIQTGRAVESLSGFPMVLLSPRPSAAKSQASILVMAQSLAGNTGRGPVQTALLKLLEQVAPGSELTIGEETLAGRPFTFVERQSTTAGGLVTRRLYGTELRGYAVIVLAQFTTGEESAAVRKVLEQLRIGAAK